WAPTAGASPWELEAEKYERALARQRRERGCGPLRRRRRGRRWLVMGLLALAALVAIGAAVGPPDEEDTADHEAGNSDPASTASTGPESVSRNRANPPQQDLHDDTECVLGTLGWVTAE